MPAGSGGERRTHFVRFTERDTEQRGAQTSEKRESGHAQGHMAMPAVPGPRLATVTIDRPDRQLQQHHPTGSGQ